MTAKIYQFDSYKRELRCTIRSIIRNAVVLDKTIFYPTSGGQSCDTGYINGVKVNKVTLEGDDIVHYLEESHVEEAEALSTNSDVICKIDWERRFANMQRHTGQHLLSAILSKDYKINTISSHLGDGYSTIDIDWTDNLKELIPKIEERVNQAIKKYIPVYIYTVKTKYELRALSLRREPKVNRNIRIVEIEGYDITPCGGTHLKNTGELWHLKIVKAERYKGMWRITFICGVDYLKYSLDTISILEKVKQQYSLPPKELANQIGKLQEELRGLKRENNKLKGIYLENVFSQLETSKIRFQQFQGDQGKYWIYHYLFDERKAGITIDTKEALEIFSKKPDLKKNSILILGKLENSDLRITLWAPHGGEKLLKKIFDHIKNGYNAKGGGKKNLYNMTLVNNKGETFDKVLADITQFPYN